MVSKNILPQESEPQRIGQRADKCFQANRPDMWRVTPLAGTEDAGFDFQIQIVESAEYTAVFRLQLKGTESPTLSEAGDFYSIAVARSTLNYYARVTEPILFILCDLSVGTVTKDCPCYYVWIHEELRRYRETGKDASGTKSLVVRVPTANRLTDDLDLLPELESHLRLHKVASVLDAVVEQKLPSSAPDERSTLIENIAGNFSRYDSTLLEVLASPTTFPWPQAPKHSFAGKLDEVGRLLSAGSVARAESLLGTLSGDLQSATTHEQAEYWYCRGRLCSWMSEEVQAESFYDQACRTAPGLPRYVVAWVEAHLAAFFNLDGPNDFSALKERLASDDPVIRTVFARVLAAEGNIDGAIEILTSLERKQALPTLTVVMSMSGRLEATISLCDEGLADENLETRHEQLFYLLRARAKFTLALPEEVRNSYDFLIASCTGPSVLDASLLRSAWSDIVTTVDLMKAAGWPTNIEFVADIWVSAALMLGRAEETYDLAKEAAAARPHLPDLQKTVELFAINIDDYSTALTANDRQPPSDERTIRRIGILHQARKHKDCLELVEANVESLPREHLLYPISVGMGALSGDQLLFVERADKLASVLLSRPEWEEHHATLKYYRAIARNVLTKKAALQEYLVDFRRLRMPLGIALQLLHALDASDIEQAADCVEVAECISEHQQLSMEGAFQLAQALATLKQWNRLLEVVDGAIAKFEHVGRFFAIRAFALDKLGLTPEALKELRRLVNASVADQFAVDTYVNIVLRSGFIEEALDLAEKLVADASQSKRRLECLQLLFSLLRAKDPSNRRVLDVALAMAPLVDQNDESSEAAFLGAIFTATSGTNIQLEPLVREQFQERLSAFFDKWPNSRILRRGFIPENASAAELLEALNAMLGDPEKHSPELLKFQRQLSRGEMAVPYTWRPQLLLRNVVDTGQLWDLGKRAGFDAHQYQLIMAINGWEERPFSERARGIPILDLPALFVVQDLGLFDTLFSVFPTVAVSQSLLVEIQERASPLSGSWAQKRYASLVEELKARFDQIQQPVSRLPADEQGPKAHLMSKEYIALLDEGRYFLYSDDAAFRLFATRGDVNSGFCTLDLLARAEKMGLLSLQDASEKVGLLCVWKVGVFIATRHYLGSLPAEVSTARSVGAAIDIIRKSHACTAMFEGMWSIRKNYAEISTLVGNLLAILVKDDRNNIQSVAAIIGVWYGRAKLRTEVQALTPIERLAMLIARTAVQGRVESVEAIKRLWDIYGRIVEMEHGNYMDEAKERESIETMGTMCARLDVIAFEDRSKTPYREAILSGLREGTSESDRFVAAYKREIATRT